MKKNGIWTDIVIKREVKDSLASLKIHPNQGCGSIIEDLLKLNNIVASNIHIRELVDMELKKSAAATIQVTNPLIQNLQSDTLVSGSLENDK